MKQETIDFVALIVSREAFHGRKGHGGGRCTKRVMTPEQLRDFARKAIRRALRTERNRIEREGR